jgi:hypothetical protein
MDMNRFFIILCLMVATWPLFAQQLYEMPMGIQSRASTPENLNGIKGAGGQANEGAKGSAFTTLKAGESKPLLDVQKAGAIQRIWVTIDDRSPEMLRALRLRIYWDGAAEPSVDVPFGDFFCAALGRPVAFQSALFTNPEGRSFNCYIPMPYRKGARITLSNESKNDLNLLFFEVDFTEVEKPQGENLYFHASWQRPTSSTLGKDLEILPAVTGRGRYLGASIGVNVNPVYENTWWGEGEVKVYLDGDSSHPTLNGTGAEDYIGTGWAEGLFAHNYQGCLVADAAHRQYAFYRWHVPDPIWFYKNCRITLQQIGGWFAPVVKGLQEKGAPLLPVSISGSAGFHGLREDSVAARGLLDKAAKDDWVNFYRTDDCVITVYYYLDRP